MVITSPEYQVDEKIVKDGDRIIEVHYEYKELDAFGREDKRFITIYRDTYEKLAAGKTTRVLSFDDFAKVLRPFMLGRHGISDIPEAFRLLDYDQSGTLDYQELSAFGPVITHHTTPAMMLNYIKKVDKNNDYQLNLAEFTNLVVLGIGRDIAFQRE